MNLPEFVRVPVYIPVSAVLYPVDSNLSVNIVDFRLSIRRTPRGYDFWYSCEAPGCGHRLFTPSTKLMQNHANKKHQSR